MTIPFPPNGVPEGGPESVGLADDEMQRILAEITGAVPPGQPSTMPQESQANDKVQATPVSPDEDPTPDVERQRQQLAALVGSDCPLAGTDPEPTDSDWAGWVRGLWQSREQAVSTHLWLIEANRLFRAGEQWISSENRQPWREPARAKETVRRKHNLFGPALDWRLNIAMEQRPGFKVNPATTDADDKQKAEARQYALEYQHDAQRMDKKAKEAAYWAQTDGVAFWHLSWDPDAGPWDERMGDTPGQRKPLGDLRTDVLRCEQVRVAPNATASTPPQWVVIREVLSAQEAAQRYGYAGVVGAGFGNGFGASTSAADPLASWVMAVANPGEGSRLRNEETVERFTVYVAPQPDVLPDGLQMVVVGDRVVWGPQGLLFGVIPVVPVRDGSSDPSYFPRPICEQWKATQQAINILLSKWYENIRVNAGGRFLSRAGSIVKETFLGGVTSVLEVNAGAIDQALVPMQGFSIGNDVKEALQLEIKTFGDLSGYNDTARGSVAGDSGRAILAAREQLERVFAPPITALAQAFTEWAKVSLAGMAWGYDVPRDLGAIGKGRPDLARQLSAEDFDGANDVIVEPSTLMPMSSSLRQFLLDNALEKGVIDAGEYRRRSPFGDVRNMETPDADQKARGERIADAILQQQPAPPMRWQDNEAIHQDVLERRILLRDDIDPNVLALADQRWKELANQAMMKQGGQPAQMSGGPPGSSPVANGGGSPSPFAPTPASQPLASANPPMAAAPTVVQAVADDPALAQALQAMPQ